MITEERPSSRTMRDYINLTLGGIAIGSANVVPGVSGGTMALILGIFEELILSIRNLLHPEAIKLLLRLKIRAALDILPWQFLLALGIGVLVATFTLAQFLEWMLLNHPVLLWAFFFGLVLASIFTVIKRVKRWNGLTIGGAIIGAIVAYLFVGLVPVETPNAAWFLFLSGFIAICTMILPGISGSFVLVLLGKYQYILSAVNNRDFVTLFIVAIGGVVGLVTFAQILGWLFKRYHDITIAVLIGLMVGSLRKIWPWKKVVSSILDRDGIPIPVEEINILPLAWTGEVTFAFILAIAGFFVVFALDYWATRREEVPA